MAESAISFAQNFSRQKLRLKFAIFSPPVVFEYLQQEIATLGRYHSVIQRKKKKDELMKTHTEKTWIMFFRWILLCTYILLYISTFFKLGTRHVFIRETRPENFSHSAQFQPFFTLLQSRERVRKREREKEREMTDLPEIGRCEIVRKRVLEHREICFSIERFEWKCLLRCVSYYVHSFSALKGRPIYYLRCFDRHNTIFFISFSAAIEYFVNV